MKPARNKTLVWRRALTLVGLPIAAMAIWLIPDMALAHDCSGPSDCEQTAGYNAVLSVAGAVSAVLAGILGSTIASGSTIPSVIAGTTPPPGRRDDEGYTGKLEDAGELEELPPGTEGGWEVEDGDGNVRTFKTKEDADQYYDNLIKQMEQESERERISQLENDYRNTAEHVEFVRSVAQGLQNAGKDASEHLRELERYIRERDQLRGQVRAAGGDTDYTPHQRNAWNFGENDEMFERQKDGQRRLETIHKMSEAIDRLQERGQVGENPNLTRKMLDRLDQMSDDMVTDGAKEPSWEEIERLKNLMRQDMDATTARNEVNDSNWVRDGAQDTAREVFTGINSDGDTSYKGMLLRGLLAAGTGGQSEIPMEVIEKTYIIHDEVAAGKSGLDAYATAVKRVFTDELTGRAVEGGLKVGGRAGGELYERTLKGTGLDDQISGGVRKANDLLQTDVSKLLRGQGDEVADGLTPRTPRTGAPETDVSHGGRGAAERQADFDAGRQRGAQKVSELDEAIEYKRNNPDAPDADARMRDAVDEVQQDKHAMHDLNARGGKANPSGTIEEFNRELKTSYEQAHQSTRQRIADEYGVPIEDVQVVKPTNSPGGSGMATDASDPRGFARRPDGAVRTDPSDYTQRAPDAEVSVHGEKASFDQDITYRVRQDGVIDPRTGDVSSGFTDVRRVDTGRVYNEEFYKSRHGGDLPSRVNSDGNIEVDSNAVNKYADDMDQASTDRLDPEAYGNGDRDLQTAVQGDYRGRDFDDVGGVGKTMEHKQYEWQNRAAETRVEANALDARANALEADGNSAGAGELRAEAADLHSKAEAQLEEGYRQTTKQMHNQIEARVEALNQHHGRNVAEVPPRLQEAVGIMEDPHLSPVQVEQQLGDIGYTPNKVVQQMSSNLEALQKFEPPPGFGIGDIEPPADFDIGEAATRGLRGSMRAGPGPGEN